MRLIRVPRQQRLYAGKPILSSLYLDKGNCECTEKRILVDSKEVTWRTLVAFVFVAESRISLLGKISRVGH